MNANIEPGGVWKDANGKWKFELRIDSIHGQLIVNSAGEFDTSENAIKAMKEFLSLVEEKEKDREARKNRSKELARRKRNGLA